jgi:hypothetical protein
MGVMSNGACGGGIARSNGTGDIAGYAGRSGSDGAAALIDSVA